MLWKIDITVPMDKATHVLDALESSYLSASCFEDTTNPTCWIVTLYTDKMPDAASLHASVNLLAQNEHFTVPDIHIAEVEEKDWVSESQNYFSPFIAGKFYIHTSWHEVVLPSGSYPIEIDPAQAFGTGTHDTTQGCLIALSELAGGYTPERILDMGTGTGILAIASRHLWPNALIVAADYDQKAVDIAGKNTKDFSVLCIHADNFCHPAITKHAPYDLILANILAIPLIEMAPQIGHILMPGGKLILSGFYDWQISEVTEAYKKQGLYIYNSMLRNQWGIVTFSTA